MCSTHVSFHYCEQTHHSQFIRRRKKNTIHKHKHLHGIPSNNKCHDILRLLTNILCCRQIAADVDRCEAAAFWFLELVFWILSVCLYVSFFVVLFSFGWLGCRRRRHCCTWFHVQCVMKMLIVTINAQTRVHIPNAFICSVFPCF